MTTSPTETASPDGHLQFFRPRGGRHPAGGPSPTAALAFGMLGYLWRNLERSFGGAAALVGITNWQASATSNLLLFTTAAVLFFEGNKKTAADKVDWQLWLGGVMLAVGFGGFLINVCWRVPYLMEVEAKAAADAALKDAEAKVAAVQAEAEKAIATAKAEAKEAIAKAEAEHKALVLALIRERDATKAKTDESARIAQERMAASEAERDRLLAADARRRKRDDIQADLARLIERGHKVIAAIYGNGFEPGGTDGWIVPTRDYIRQILGPGKAAVFNNAPPHLIGPACNEQTRKGYESEAIRNRITILERFIEELGSSLDDPPRSMP